MLAFRSHLRSNAIAYLALFVSLGGTSAYAASHLGANSVGTKQLRNGAVTGGKVARNAVNGAKVADHSLTGADLDVSKLGTVPRAAEADHAGEATHAGKADRATSAGDASTLGGSSSAAFLSSGAVHRIDFNPECSAICQAFVLSAEGFVLHARCERNATQAFVDLDVSSAPAGSDVNVVYWDGNDVGHHAGFAGTGGSLFTISGSASATLVMRSPTKTVSATLHLYAVAAAGSTDSRCEVQGTALTAATAG